MFGKNELVGPGWFDKVSADCLAVTSVFFTLQGEGPYAGLPALFVRLAKCNLACSFCDTYFDQGEWYTLNQLREIINQTIYNYFEDYVPGWARFEQDGYLVKKREIVLVVTGGEPTLQHKNLVPFLDAWNKEFAVTQIESNGLIDCYIPEATTLVVSPKCAEKNGVATKYLKPNMRLLPRANALKFVLTSDKTSPYHTIPDWAFDWRNQYNGEIFVSPMNMYKSQPVKTSGSIEERSIVNEVISFWDENLLDRDANRANHEYCAKYCMQHGLRLNLQMHLYASLA